MDEVCRDKQRFVDRKLAPMLVALGVGVAGCDYALDGRLEEFVWVRFENGFKRRVCVTGDSNLAIALDVLGALG